MGAKRNEESWTLEGLFGPEKWTRRVGRFIEAVVGEKRIQLEPPNPDLDQLGLRTGPCKCGGPWPHAFSFCPECGTPLNEPAPMPLEAQWCAPFGEASGLPTLSLPMELKANPTAEELPLPPETSLSFMIAGRPSRLIAYDHRQGHLYRWIDGPDDALSGGSWTDILKLEPGQLARWSWSAASFPYGIAMPIRSGAVWIDLRPTHPCRAIASDALTQAPLGGAACLARIAALPVRREGRLAIAYWIEGSEAWHHCEVADAPDVADQTFAVPVVTRDEAYWVAPGGQIHLSVSAESVSAHWVVWADGFAPNLGIRPVQSPDGSLYQIGLTPEGKSLHQMLRPSYALPNRLETRGLSLSSGRAVFLNGRRYRMPGEREAQAEYILDEDQGEFVFPLLAFDDRRYLLAICPQRTKLQEFVNVETPATDKRRCMLVFSSGTRQRTILGKSVLARAPWEIVTFIHRNCLHVYSTGDNVGWRWKLQDITSSSISGKP